MVAKFADQAHKFSYERQTEFPQTGAGGRAGRSPGSEFELQAERKEPAGLELQAVDALVNWHLHEGKARGALADFHGDPRTQIDEGAAAVVAVGSIQ